MKPAGEQYDFDTRHLRENEPEILRRLVGVSPSKRRNVALIAAKYAVNHYGIAAKDEFVEETILALGSFEVPFTGAEVGAASVSFDNLYGEIIALLEDDKSSTTMKAFYIARAINALLCCIPDDPFRAVWQALMAFDETSEEYRSLRRLILDSLGE